MYRCIIVNSVLENMAIPAFLNLETLELKNMNL